MPNRISPTIVSRELIHFKTHYFRVFQYVYSRGISRAKCKRLLDELFNELLNSLSLHHTGQ